MASPFLFGFEGTRASRGVVRLLRETDAAGILLLARNITSPAQVRALVHGLEDALGRRLIVSIDHEGGWVLRFTHGVTFFPGNAALGRIGDPALAEQAGAVMAREMGAMGVNLNLAPVLDVLGPGYNPGIGIRSYGRDPLLVGRMGAAFVRGQEGHGVAACAKHFPGKGAATIDAHVDLPVIKVSRRELEDIHLAPFRDAIRAGVASIMTSHVLMPAIDRKVPATFSRRAVHDLLRKRLGYRGLIVSDDLCMGAVTKRMPLGTAAVEALGAGHDLLIVAHGESLMREAAEAVGLALEGGLLAPAERRAMEKRLADFPRRWTPGRKAAPPPARELARRIADGALEVLRVGRPSLPLRWPSWKKPRILAVWPDLGEVRERFAFEGGPAAPGARVRSALSRWPARLSWALSPVTSDRTPDPVGAAARSSDLVLFFCFEARRFPGQRRTLELLKKSAPGKVVNILLRSPADLDLLDSDATALTAHGYRESQIEALLEALR